jgi:hypothetical protein
VGKQCEVAKERDDLRCSLREWHRIVMRLLRHAIRSTPINEQLYTLPATPEVSKILHELEDRLAGM